MKLLQLSATLLIGAPLLLTVSTVQADDSQHLYEAAQANPDLKAAFADLIAPVAKKAAWIQEYGTTAPPTKVTVDETDYAVYWGCKPKDCTTESYTVAYDTKAKKMVGGAFVSNQLSGPNASTSSIQWLGATDWDLVKALGPYLY